MCLECSGKNKEANVGWVKREWEEDGKDATGARLGKASRASKGLWLLPQAMEHRNDMSNSNLKGSTQMFTEYRQMIIRQRASLVAQTVKNLPAMWERQVQSLGGKSPLRRKWLPTPVFLPGKFHGQRSLASYTVHGVTKSWTWLSN